MRLIGNFYAYLWPGLTVAEMRRYGNNCNSYLVANGLLGGKHVLIDPGMEVNEAGQNCLGRLVSEMAKDGIKIEDTGLILNTHAHPDHYGASESIRKISGTQVAIGKGEENLLKLAVDDTFRHMKNTDFQMPVINPDFYLVEGELRLGEHLFARIILTSGHSPGHLGIYWPEAKIFMAGDLIFNKSTGRVDIPGGNAEQLKESIETVAGLDIEYLLTGHQYGSPGIIQGRQQITDNFNFIRTQIYPLL